MINATIVRRQAAEGAASVLSRHLHPVLARLYAARSITAVEELECSLNRLHGVGELAGIAAAAEVIADHIRRDRRIMIVADFDTDGATSCAVAVRALSMLGARQVDYLVPNRFEYGYGLTPEIVAVAARRRPDLIITVDNGIASVAGVAAANAAGIEVIITDHHLPGPELPAARAIVNPNQHGDTFPSKCLAGVGVVFYVMLALRAHLRDSGWFERHGSEPNLARLLDLVALGTVADLVPLDYNNRVLVSHGLERMRRGHASPGIQALMEVAGRRMERICANDLGYAVAPRLNAAGRLEDMSLGIACLLADDLEAARPMAAELDRLNAERRQIEGQMHAEALQALEVLPLDADGEPPAGICLYDERWHQGVIGILASRIKERLHRPTIAFAAAGADGELKGSARSVPGLHIRNALEAIAAAHPGLLTRFGGHAMAAGLSLRSADLERFRDAFSAEAARWLSPADLRGAVYSDGALAAEHHTVEVAQLIRDAGPWGQAFPEPVFDGVFEVVSRRVVGERHLKLLLRLPGAERPLDAIAFNTDAAAVADRREVHLAYKLDVNDYRGQRSAQLLVEHIQVPQPVAAAVS